MYLSIVLSKLLKKVLINKKWVQNDFNKGQRNQEDNYRSVTILPNITIWNTPFETNFFIFWQGSFNAPMWISKRV